MILRAQLKLQQGNLKEAKEIMHSIESSGFYNSDVYYLSAQIDRKLGLVDQAEKKLIKALTYSVHTPYVFFSLSLIFNQTKRHSKAIRCLKKFLTLVETPEAHYQLGLALHEMGHYSDACIHYS